MVQDVARPPVQPPAVDAHHTPGNADDGGAGRHRLDDYRARPHLGPIAHADIAQDDGMGANDDAVPHGRMPLGPLRGGTPQDRALVHQHIIAHFRRLADDHTRAVIDKEPPADACPRMDFDAGQEAPDVRDDACQGEVLVLPQAVGYPVQPTGMQTRVASQDLQQATSCRVLVVYGLDILAQELYPTQAGLFVPLVHRRQAPIRHLSPRPSLQIRQGNGIQCLHQAVADHLGVSHMSLSALLETRTVR